MKDLAEIFLFGLTEETKNIEKQPDIVKKKNHIIQLLTVISGIVNKVAPQKVINPKGTTGVRG